MSGSVVRGQRPMAGGKQLGSRGLHFEADAELAAGGFAHAPAAFFAGLFVVADAFHVLDEAFFFTKLFEAAQHLFGGFIAAGLDLDHANPCLLLGRVPMPNPRFSRTGAKLRIR